jgi:DNA-binding response OmpR family regulator
MPTSTRPTILLVEDDPLLRDAFRLLLEDAGYRVVEAGSAAEAFACVDREVPSLILLDLGLPDRPGLDVARTLRRQPATLEVPIVALTGHTGARERRACLDAGCTTFLPKPIEPRELLHRLPELLMAR